MAADSELTTVVTCEGDLSDFRFPAQLKVVVDRLNGILGDKVKVRKLEPWNSVRVTLSIPREAALRLRQLANEGSQQLRALGILSVQVEGDQVISLRLATGSVNSEPQEIILRTADGTSGSSDHHDSVLGLSNFLQTNATATPAAAAVATSANNTQVQFKSPNVVCPPDTVVPKVGASVAAPNNVPSSNKAFVGPFPFTSMNQAIHSNRETPFNSLPPPYPGKHPPVTISSPLLVNLLQNDGAKDSGVVAKAPTVRSVRTPPVTSVHKTFTSTTTMISSTVAASTAVKSTTVNPIPTQANVLVNNSISPSALSTNTSIRQNSTILTSTTGAVKKSSPPLPPPPQYHRALSTSMVKQQPVSGYSSMPQTSTALSSLSLNSSTSSYSSLSLSQSNIPPPSVSIQQMNMYQPQSTATAVQQQKKSLLPTTASKQMNLSAISSSAKYHLPHKNVTLPQVKNPLLSVNMPSAKSSAIPVVPPKNSVFNNVSGHMKKLPPHLKTNPYMSQPLKMARSSFGPPSIAKSTVLQPVVKSSPIVPTSVPSNSMETVNTSQASLENVMLRGMPSPPPYSVAISRPWDTLVHSNPLMDLTPSLTDLKADDLDELLPSLERELTQSPLPELPEDFLAVHSSIISTTEDVTPPDDKRKFLINPLTGELEPQPSDESDTEDLKDVFTGLLSPAALSDEDTCSTTRPDTTTDQSDSETRSSDTNKPARLKNSKVRDRGRDSPALKTEKIKLRLKLEKSEPINPAYKVDVSFINSQPKKASTSMIVAGEELRVPPLHISLRGRNSVVIKNKSKLNPDGSPAKAKIRKNPEHGKVKKTDVAGNVFEEPAANVNNLITGGEVPLPQLTTAEIKARIASLDQKKIKKFKSNHEHKDIIASLTQESDLKSKFVIHNHYKEKQQKERRGSDSDLVRNNNKKFVDSNGIASCDEKKRRLSQSELENDEQPSVLGSTNVGTIASLPQKPRKDKLKIKDVFKKDAGRNKIFSGKNLEDKLQQTKTVTLPTAGEMNMEAKFKQGLLEGSGEKGVLRPPHRTETVNHLSTENNRIEVTEKAVKTIPEATSLKEKSPEPDKCNTPDRKSVELNDKPSVVTGGRSPNSGGGQGEDSGIESMDALSEKSPNQASQSPHADILPPKTTQVPNMLDIEAQLAKMEGLNGDTDRGGGNIIGVGGAKEDVNENKCHLDQAADLTQCCELTCALQDSLKQGAVSLSAALPSPALPMKQQVEVSLVPLKVKKEDEDLEPLPLRVTPALYTYSNPDKEQEDFESIGISDEDSNSCSTSGSAMPAKQGKSLLEQLLIEIPNDHQGVPSSPSPATRSSVRTRALSKLGSPELSSPVTKNTRTAVQPAKRKRNESDSSTQSLDETKKKARKGVGEVQHLVEATMKTRQPNNSVVKKAAAAAATTTTKLQQDESSDSDEPLIEKVRKPPPSSSTAAINTPRVNSVVVNKSKMKSGPGIVANNNKTVMVNTRRSVRSNMPAQNTRSKGDKVQQSESEALRRKTRSTVADVESKRKKEVK